MKPCKNCTKPLRKRIGKGDWRRRAAVERARIEENFDAIDWSQDVGKVFDGEKFVLKEENDDEEENDDDVCEGGG